ncbi:MAG: 5'-methylthioadenosine phosphorylase [Euryarchaeota archaeon]|nr:5'-methylthioadenosine phosphorylase [Euryarchaeota archaeon]
MSARGALAMRLGVIGGTGLISMDLSQRIAEVGGELIRTDDVRVETPFGQVPLRCFRLNIEGKEHELIFLQRHHSPSGHGCPPHMIDHKANITAMSESNVDAILSVCSVGAIAATFAPGKVALAQQYIDFTGVATTFHDDESTFTSVTVPFDETMNETLEHVLRTAQSFDAEEPLRYTYWLTQGPQFETVAEVDAIETLGGDMVGMTMPREAKLARELDLPYAAVCISSNWAAGRDPSDAEKDLDHEEVSTQANDRLDPVWACIFEMLS